MELFELLAKLTLDASEYEKALKEAESQGGDIEDVEAHLGLNKSEFDSGIESAESEEVELDDAELGLDKTSFDETVEEAEGTEVDDPDEPDLDLNDQPFQDTVVDAEATEVDDPDSPELDLETKPYNDALEQSQADTETWSGAIGDIFSELKGVIAAAGIAAIVTGIVSNLSEAVDLARSMGDSIDKQSRAMSLSTDAYQEWAHVLDINGASITDLNRGLMNMRKLMGGGKVAEEAQNAFDTLGLSAKVANGEIKSTEELLDASLKALADFQGSAEERDVLAQALFGRGGTKLNAMFDGTSQDIEDLKKQAHDLGLVMGEDAVANAAAYNDSVTNMQASIEAFKISLVENFLPVLTEINNTIATIVSAFNLRNNKKDATLADVFEDIDAKALVAAQDTEKAAETAKTLIQDLADLGDYWTLDDEGKMTWDTLAAKALELFPQLSEYIDKDGKKIQGNTKDIEANIDAWSRLEKQRILSAAMDEKRVAVAKQLQTAYEKGAESRAKEAEGTWYEQQFIDIANAQLARGYEQNLSWGQKNFAQYWEEKMGYAAPKRFDESNFAEYYRFAKNYMPHLGANVYEYMDAEGNLISSDKAHSDMNALFNEYTPIHDEAEKLRTEADSLRTEAEEAQQKLSEYEQFLIEEMGLVSETATTATGDVEGVGTALDNLPDHKDIDINIRTNGTMPIFYPKAKGDWNVPYDGYPALLHRGERVLTASQARQIDSGSGGSIDFSGMYDIVERAIRSGMSGVSVNSFLSGKDVTDDVNRNTGRQLKARRFRG